MNVTNILASSSSSLVHVPGDKVYTVAVVGRVVSAEPFNVVPDAACTDTAVILLVELTYHLAFMVTELIVAPEGISEVSKQ